MSGDTTFGRDEEMQFLCRMGQRWPGLLCIHWNTEQFAACSQEGSNSLCQSGEHSPASAGTNASACRAVPVLAISSEPVAESALASQQGVCLQQSKQCSAVREELLLAGLWLHVHWLRLVGNFCCNPKLFLRPLKISLLCFRAIINHFNPKIESYAAVNHISQLSEDQVSQAYDDHFSMVSSAILVFRSSLCSLGLITWQQYEGWRQDFHVPCSDVSERKRNKARFSQFYHHMQISWSSKCRSMGTNDENMRHCQQLQLETADAGG